MSAVKSKLTLRIDILFLMLIPILFTYVILHMNLPKFGSDFLLCFVLHGENNSANMQIYYPMFGVVSLFIIVFRKYNSSDLGFSKPHNTNGDIVCSFAISLMLMFFLIQLSIIFLYAKLIRLFYYFPIQDVINLNTFLKLSPVSRIICYASALILYGILPGLGFALIKTNIDKLIKPKSKYFNWGSFVCVFLFIFIHILYAYNSGDLVTEVTRFFFRFIFIYTTILTVDLSGTSWSCPLLFTFLWHAC